MDKLNKIVSDVMKSNHDHTSCNIEVFAVKLKKAIDGDNTELLSFLRDIYIKNVYVTLKLYSKEDYIATLNGEIREAVLTLPPYMDKTAYCLEESAGLSAKIAKEMKADSIYKSHNVENTIGSILRGVDPTYKFKKAIADNANLILEYLPKEDNEEKKEEEKVVTKRTKPEIEF